MEYDEEQEGAVAGPRCWDVCKLFCWPPLPSRIVAKLSFAPPSPATYTFVGPEHQQTMLIQDPTTGEMDAFTPPGQLHLMHVRTRRRNNVACWYLEVPDSRYTVLFSHGNAVDIGYLVAHFLTALMQELRCSVMVYDYSGYGLSSGNCLEANLYADIDAVWDTLRTSFGVPANRIILYGQSIGSVPTTYLAARLGRSYRRASAPDFALGGVVLHSPLASGLRVLRPTTRRTWCFDPFRNIERIPRIMAPTLIIHGTADNIVGVSHGRMLHERCEAAVEPLFVDRGGHNDLEMFASYQPRLRRFLDEVDASQHMAAS